MELGGHPPPTIDKIEVSPDSPRPRPRPDGRLPFQGMVPEIRRDWLYRFLHRSEFFGKASADEAVPCTELARVAHKLVRIFALTRVPRSYLYCFYYTYWAVRWGELADSPDLPLIYSWTSILVRVLPANFGALAAP